MSVKKTASAGDLDRKFESGENMADYFDWSSARRPRQEVEGAREVERVDLDLPKALVAKLEEAAKQRGVTREGLIEMWINERVDKAALPPAPCPSVFNATTRRRNEAVRLVCRGFIRRLGIVASSRFKNDWPAAGFPGARYRGRTRPKRSARKGSKRWRRPRRGGFPPSSLRGAERGRPAIRFAIPCRLRPNARRCDRR